jgi:hypothetical protein
MLCALQGENLVGFTALYHDSVNLAHANCTEGLFQLDDTIQKIRG